MPTCHTYLHLLFIGIRPERLQQFQPDCWELMNESWDGNPSRRPLLGDVEVKLRAIYRRNYDEQGKKQCHHSQRLSTGPLPSETGLSSVDMDSIWRSPAGGGALCGSMAGVLDMQSVDMYDTFCHF